MACWKGCYMSERAEMVAWVRGELVGPSRPLSEAHVVEFVNAVFVDPVPVRRGPLAWRPAPTADPEEVLYYDRESPHRKYGVGLLHPVASPATTPPPDEAALQATDTVGAEPGMDESRAAVPNNAAMDTDDDVDASGAVEGGTDPNPGDDFEVTSPDIRHPSTIGVSFCLQLDTNGEIVIRLPQMRCFSWQSDGASPFPLNGRYELCTRRWTDEDGHAKEAPVWRRSPAMLPDTGVTIRRSELVSGKKISKPVKMPEGSPLTLLVEVFPRQLQSHDKGWLLTVVLRNSTVLSNIARQHESVLYQTFFEVQVFRGRFQKYPESRRPFAQLDRDEQSLALLYRDSATWGIGHGCAAGWDAEPGGIPATLYADVLPAVQLPSMTPDVTLDGNPVKLSMRDLATLSEEGDDPGWQSLESLAAGYGAWIQLRRNEATNLPPHLATVAKRHLDDCNACLLRINAGIALLRKNAGVRSGLSPSQSRDASPADRHQTVGPSSPGLGYNPAPCETPRRPPVAMEHI
ncbi:MAG: hypothetical protein QM771_16240 [Nitrospira sp.]